VIFSNIKSMTRFVWISSKKRGFIYSLRIALAELSFEIKYQIDTISIRPIDHIADVSAADKENAVHYQGSYVWVVKKMLAKLADHTNNRGTFIDLGSGKGRVMMQAGLQGYQNIIGVEFSNALNQICEENLAAFKKKSRCSSQFTTVTRNVMVYDIPTETSVVYLGNPFGAAIMLKVLEQIEDSLKKQPREIFIAYFNPLNSDLLLQHGYHVIMVEKDPSGAVIFQAFKKAVTAK